MGNGLRSRHALDREIASRLPQRNRAFTKARFRKVMGQHFGLGGLDVREALLDHPCDLGV
jgi:hypothetical protein